MENFNRQKLALLASIIATVLTIGAMALYSTTHWEWLGIFIFIGWGIELVSFLLAGIISVIKKIFKIGFSALKFPVIPINFMLLVATLPLAVMILVFAPVIPVFMVYRENA